MRYQQPSYVMIFQQPNMLVFDSPQGYWLRLCDFGYSRTTWRHAISLGVTDGPGFGTVPWMAPEMIYNDSNTDTRKDIKCDIWSLGCTIFELLANMNPYPGVQPVAIPIWIKEGKSPMGEDKEIPLAVADFAIAQDVRDLISECCTLESQKRPLITKILERLIEIHECDRRIRANQPVEVRHITHSRESN